MSRLYSVRMSVLAMTYGRPVAEDRINLDWTRAGIGIDNLNGLPLERRVRARNLVAARSGVYSEVPFRAQGGRWTSRLSVFCAPLSGANDRWETT
ncbi:hypothetical protein P3T24_006483 [Paraburkholderia sp. GAS33]|jgi:hypothetical protein|uniref:hypothetical protein n=1 Tax=Paraburkholderia sp. GAS33 TaxID=3035130 RepID=UPI003D1EAB8A